MIMYVKMKTKSAEMIKKPKVVQNVVLEFLRLVDVFAGTPILMYDGTFKTQKIFVLVTNLLVMIVMLEMLHI